MLVIGNYLNSVSKSIQSLEIIEEAGVRDGAALLGHNVMLSSHEELNIHNFSDWGRNKVNDVREFRQEDVRNCADNSIVRGDDPDLKCVLLTRLNRNH